MVHDGKAWWNIGDFLGNTDPGWWLNHPNLRNMRKLITQPSETLRNIKTNASQTTKCSCLTNLVGEFPLWTTSSSPRKTCHFQTTNIHQLYTAWWISTGQSVPVSTPHPAAGAGSPIKLSLTAPCCEWIPATIQPGPIQTASLLGWSLMILGDTCWSLMILDTNPVVAAGCSRPRPSFSSNSYVGAQGAPALRSSFVRQGVFVSALAAEGLMIG